VVLGAISLLVWDGLELPTILPYLLPTAASLCTLAPLGRLGQRQRKGKVVLGTMVVLNWFGKGVKDANL